MEKIDIIIKSWNAVDYTLRAIESIENNTTYPHRIIVVDDGSEKETVATLRKLKGILLIEHKENKGSAPTTTTGYEASESSKVVIMDSDVVVPNGWLENLLTCFADPKIAIVSPLRHGLSIYPGSSKKSKDVWESIKNKGGTPEEGLKKYLNGYSLAEFGKKIVEQNKINDSFVTCPPGFVSASCIMVSRPHIEMSGGIMSPEFQSYGEDVDLCWRVASKGYTVLRTNKVYVHHFEHSSIAFKNIDYFALMDKSNMILFKKWGKQILELERKLIEKYGIYEVRTKFPFIKVFKDIKKYGHGKSF